MTSVFPARLRSLIISRKSVMASGERFEVGSSKKYRSTPATRAHAHATRWSSPPESESMRRPRNCVMWVCRVAWAILSSITAGDTP